MTATSQTEPSTPRPTGLALRAAVPGFAAALVGGTAVVLSGGLPEGSAPFVAAGCAAAALTGAVGVRLKAGVVAPANRSADPRQEAQRLQIAVFGDFALQLLTVGAGMVGLYLAGLKFTSMAGFALAFATVALAHQLGSALVFARTLRRRAAASRGSSVSSLADSQARPERALAGVAGSPASNDSSLHLPR
jgi:hypothetical protein